MLLNNSVFVFSCYHLGLTDVEIYAQKRVLYQLQTYMYKQMYKKHVACSRVLSILIKLHKINQVYISVIMKKVSHDSVIYSMVVNSSVS